MLASSLIIKVDDIGKNMNDKPVNIRKVDVMAYIFEGKGKLDGRRIENNHKGKGRVEKRREK